MTTSALYTPDNRMLELSQVTESDMRLLESLRGNIKRGQTILLCQHPGGDPEMFVWRDSRTGRYWAKHFAGGGHPGGHQIHRMTLEHQRGTECWVTAWSDAGYSTATEVTTNNRARFDAVAFGPRITGLEVQVQPQETRRVKARHTQRLNAKALTGSCARTLDRPVETVWFAPVGQPEWLYKVPSFECGNRSWEIAPRPSVVPAIGARSIDVKPCRPPWFQQCPVKRRNFCDGSHLWTEPRGGLSIADVAAMITEGQLVPVEISGRAVYYTDPASREVFEDFAETGPGPEPWPHPIPRPRPPADCDWSGHDAVSGPQAAGSLVFRCRVCGSPVPIAQPRCAACSDPAPAVIPPLRGSTPEKPKWMCDTPGCAEWGRPYAHGQRCDAHKPRKIAW
jgi:hypothetical protein